MITQVLRDSSSIRSTSVENLLYIRVYWISHPGFVLIKCQCSVPTFVLELSFKAPNQAVDMDSWLLVLTREAIFFVSPNRDMDVSRLPCFWCCPPETLMAFPLKSQPVTQNLLKVYDLRDISYCIIPPQWSWFIVTLWLMENSSLNSIKFWGEGISYSTFLGFIQSGKEHRTLKHWD